MSRSTDDNKSPTSILTEHYGIKVDEKFVLKLTKEIKNVYKKVKESCKVLHFSPEWNFEKVLVTIDLLDPKEYPQLFTFIIETINFGLTANNQEQSSTLLVQLHKKLLKFGIDRPIIIQLTSQEENVTKIYYKEEALNKFTDINHQQDELEDSQRFPSFLRSFLNGKFNDSETKILDALRKYENCSLILRFLQTLTLSEGFFRAVLLDVATKGSKAELLAALDSPFESDGRILSIRSQSYIFSVFKDDVPENDDSILLTAMIKENTEVTDYLITYWTHLIQQLPFDHQVKISTVALETNQLDVLCDLLDIADFPFPDNFKPEIIEHPRLCEITSVGVFYYLKSLGFQGEKCDEILSTLSKEEKERAVKQAINRRKMNVKKTEDVAPTSVMMLFMRSSLHNSRTEKNQASKYQNKIIKWFIDIHKVAPELIDVAASCDYLKMIFDFESDSVEYMSWAGSNAAGSMDASSNWIFIDTKLSDRYGNVTKQREQQIKGVLAHKLCHYVMRLVYENHENPYYEDRKYIQELFEEIVRIIDKWSSEDSENPDDECNGIISSVFKLYDPIDFHLELIVRVVQILSEFDDNEDKLNHLEKKYEVIFDFWHGQVIPELHKYLQKNQEVIRLNGFFKLLSSIKNLKYELRNSNEIKKIAGNKLVVVQTNVPKLLFLNIREYLQQMYGNLFDSQNIFVDLEKLRNQHLWDDFKQICSNNQELSIFVDCSKDIPDYLENIFVNKELNFIFIVSKEVHCDKLHKIFKEQQTENAQNLEINYNWSDLTQESQKLMLHTKINFQNNSQLTLNDLIEIDPKACKATQGTNTENFLKDIHDLIDDQLLNLILENLEISINSKESVENSEKYFKLLFQSRKFVKKTLITDNKAKLDIENSDSEKKEPSRFLDKVFRIFSMKKISKPSNINLRKIKEQKFLEVELLSEFKNKQQYILISDQAGNGKSWAMKNFTNILREKNYTSWVTYVDLKQFIDEFKAQKCEPEFSTFMVEKILKLRQKFEVKIFQKLYKNGKVFILFDGFDGIAPNCAEFVSKLAQNFESNGGNQLWIATRDYFEVDLKQNLQLDVAYGLDMMTEKEGIEFIAKSWVLMDSIGKNELKSKEDFEECIKKSPNFKIYKQKARRIIKKALIYTNDSVGLPQLFKMIADGFKNEDNIDDLHGFKIYLQFIKTLYKRWSEQNGPIRNEASIDSQCYELNFYKFHQFHAILSLFPKLAVILFPGYDGSEWSDEKVIACGILTRINGKYNFIHETYRDYFVADAIANALRNNKVEKEVLKTLDEVLTVDKFKIIRTFLFPALNEKSILEKVKPQIENGVYCGRIFEQFFTENQENLADFAIKVLKNGNYEKVKAVLNENAWSIARNTQSSKMFSKFQDLIINILKIEDLKKLIIKGTIFLGIIRSSLEIEIFEEFVIKTEQKTNRDFVRQGLMLLSDSGLKGNIFYYLAKSSNLNDHKVRKFLRIMKKFFTATEIIDLVSKCNKNGQNVLQVFVEKGNKQGVNIIWTEIEKYFANNSFSQGFKEFVEQQDNSDQNILHLAARNNDVEFHEILWELLLNTFENRKELEDFILQTDEYGNNFVFNLVNMQKNESIVEWTFKILKENFCEAQFNEILRSKGLRRMNLLQSAAFWSENVEVHKFLWKTLRDLCRTEDEFFKISTEINEYNQNILHIATLKSSSDVFEFMIQEYEKVAPRDEIRDMLSNIDYKDQNLLQTAAWWNKSLEFHKLLWKTFRKYFEESEILRFIKYIDKYENNILFTAAKNNSKEIVELTWNEIKCILDYDEQIEYLKLRNDKTKIESIICQDPNVKKWIEVTLEECGIQSENKPTINNKGEVGFIKTFVKMTDYEPIVHKTKENKEPLKLIWSCNTAQAFYFVEIYDEQSTEVCEKFIDQEIGAQIIEYPIFEAKKVYVQDLISDSGCSLLIFAVKIHNYNIIESLLTYNFDINHEDNEHQSAIDHAWINYKDSQDDDDKIEIEAVMMILLNANSRLPNKKFKFSFDEAPEKVKEFIIKCEDLHKRVANNEQLNIDDLPNNKLRYLHDRHNESLLLFALKLRKIGFIKEFGNFLSIRHDEVYYELTRDPRTKFISSHREIPKPHIIMLKSKTEIYGKNYQHHKNWICIDKIYNLLDQNEVFSKVLQIAAVNRKLKIIFCHSGCEEASESRSSNSQYSTTTIYTNKQVYISSKLLLNIDDESGPSKASEDELEIAKIVIYKLSEVVITMLCMDDYEGTNHSQVKEETAWTGTERTVRNVFNSFSESIFDYFQNLDTGDIIYILRILQNEDEVIKFESLLEPMQKRILKSKVAFQGVEVELSVIIDGNIDVLTHLPSKLIKDILIRKMTIKIGEAFNMDSNYEILDRKLVEYQTSISDKKLKTSILVDDFGTGKSTTFQSMSVKFKLESKSSWVCLIKLINSSKILQKYCNQNLIIDEKLVVNLLREIINPQSELEAAVFENLFLKHKVILLVDDIDEIEPNLAEFCIMVLGWIAAELKNKLWISTCPVFLSKIHKHLKKNLYRFDPYFDYFSYQLKLIKSLFKEFKYDDISRYELNSFISFLEDHKIGKHYSIMNCGMIRAIIETYVNNEAAFKEDTVNVYLIFEKIYTKQQNTFNKYILDKSCNPFESFLISKVHQVYALKSIFSKKLIKELAIMKNWEREEQKWTKEMIGRRGFISFDEDGFHFIHRSYAKFFVAQYLISYIFSYDYCISDDEFKKIFNIVRFLTQKYDDFEIICKFIIGYAKSRDDCELHETMREVINNNIKHIQEDINSSENATNLKEFWSEIVKSDKELLEKFE